MTALPPALSQLWGRDSVIIRSSAMACLTSRFLIEAAAWTCAICVVIFTRLEPLVDRILRLISHSLIDLLNELFDQRQPSLALSYVLPTEDVLRGMTRRQLQQLAGVRSNLRKDALIQRILRP